MKEITKNFSVYGMSCAACSARVERAVKNTEGVKSVAVSLLTNEMRVTFSPPATEKSIIDSVVKAGYSAAVQADKKSKNAPIGRLTAYLRSF